MKSKKITLQRVSTDTVKEIQGRSISFATEGVGVMNKCCSESFTNIQEILTKVRATRRKFKTFKEF